LEENENLRAHSRLIECCRCLIGSRRAAITAQQSRSIAGNKI
jgi:hypothetical protein